MLDLPPRPSDAPGGAEITRDVRTLDLGAREERIYAEISRGNVPTWLRHLRRVEMTGEVNGRQHRVTFWVTPDDLAVGSDVISREIAEGLRAALAEFEEIAAELEAGDAELRT